MRASQVRTVDRSERIRTYNYPENRITDHRTGFKAYNLDAVLDGDLDPVIQSCCRRRRGRPPRCDRRPVSDLRAAVREATARLAAAGIPSPETDAVALAAHALGHRARRGAAVHGARRARTAGVRRRSSPSARPGCRCSTSPARAHFRRLTLAVGPGVFVPRPETEVIGRARPRRGIRHLGRVPSSSTSAPAPGAIALAVKDELPAARVLAVELSDLAHGWAVANRDRLGSRRRRAPR